MRTATIAANDISIGARIIINQDALDGCHSRDCEVASIKCLVRDHLIEIEARDGVVLRAIVRHSLDWPVAVAA